MPAKHHLRPGDSEGSDYSSSDGAQPQPPKKKSRGRAQRVEVNEADIVHGKRQPRSTRRKEAMEADAMEKMRMQMQKMKKKVAHLKAKSSTGTAQGRSVSMSDDSDDDLESEEDAVPSAQFTSIRQIPLHNDGRSAPLRRDDEARDTYRPQPSAAMVEPSQSTSRRHAQSPTGIDSSSTISHQRSPNATPPSPPPQSVVTTGHDPLEEAEREEARALRPIKYAAGREPSGRAKAKDYEPAIERLIKDGAQIYKTLLVSEYAFPTPEQQKVWARECWDHVCSKGGEAFSTNGLERLLYAIYNRGSSLRGAFKDNVRALVPVSLGINTTPSGSKATARNRERVRYLLAHKNGQPRDPPRYCYNKRKDFQRFAESNLVIKLLQNCLFKHAQDVGVVFESKCNPIPLPLIALILTMIGFAIEEWSAGIHSPSNFTEETHHESYKAHLKWVTDWAETNPQVIEGIRRTMYTRIRQLCPFLYNDTLDREPHGISEETRRQMQEEYAGRTGETDLEESSDSAGEEEPGPDGNDNTRRNID
ncbi:hypothetical protein K474DRAFT_1676884 [Panus rudis PR-1116 ss-1]|nr:hypothetical protein K474DRAFT_1676884 [Panus rudis PR-1116 ss-1]